MTRNELTAAMQDYLKAAYLLREHGQEITVLGLAQALDVSSPSVTSMVKRLASLGLLQHTAYSHIQLTPAGEAVALEVVRHHRLLELYLAEFLGMPWEDVHAEADRLEHHISEDLEERIAERLGQPTFDPHGDPIPTRELVVPRRDVVPLGAMPPGASGVVAQIGRQDRGLLQYLGTLGVVPGAAVTLVSVDPYGGVVTLRVGPAAAPGEAPQGATHAIGRDLAAQILVTPAVTTKEGAR
jgi:DtxR family transcriptional regulator, Mn-dependent transcriptional regulator